MEKLEYIDVMKITPHKDNPRKDLGDISELVESIRQNGILQNLTVVKRYGEITGEWNGNYTVIIGHRRLAAARKAGLKEVPCVVAENERLDRVYDFLQSIGYEMSDEEKAMRDGTHEVFREERDDGQE